jgi:hypothetical protein
LIRATTIDLINESPEAHGVFDPPNETTTTVFAEIRSVSRREFYEAANANIIPEFVFKLTDYADYGGQKVFVYNGERWRVIRTYTNGQTLEITAGRATNDAAITTTSTEVADNGNI